MAEQSFKNHARYVPMWHFVTTLILLALLVGSIVNLVHADAHTHYSAALLVLISIVLIIYFIFIRLFPLRAQDRAIRAEENFRHFVLTGKRLDARLRMGQIIALRFASDEEFPALAQRAADEQLAPKQIKEAIKQWRTDYNRL